MNHIVDELKKLALRDPLESISAEFPEGYYEEHVEYLVKDTRKWLEATDRGSDKLDTPPGMVAEIRRTLLENGACQDFMKSPEWWGKLEKLLKNPGLAEVMFEGGITSRFLPMLLLTMPSSMALEPAFMHGLTTKLTYEELTPDDVYYETARREDLFKYIRIRSAFSGDVLDLVNPKKSVFYNCGRMFATRFITSLKDEQLAYCTDVDPAVWAEALFPDPSDRKHYVVFNRQNEEFVMSEMARDATFAESLGRIIYTFTKEDYTMANQFMVKAISALKPDGVMVFDLNSEHHDWEKLLLPMAWARGNITMTLLKDNHTIKEFVRCDLLKGAPVKELIAKDVVLHGKDIGVVFAAVRA